VAFFMGNDLKKSKEAEKPRLSIGHKGN